MFHQNSAQNSSYKQKSRTLNSDGNFKSQQCGVIRTNCLDCLDRTNAVQMMFAMKAIELQAAEMGIDPSQVTKFKGSYLGFQSTFFFEILASASANQALLALKISKRLNFQKWRYFNFEFRIGKNIMEREWQFNCSFVCGHRRAREWQCN